MVFSVDNSYPILRVRYDKTTWDINYNMHFILGD